MQVHTTPDARTRAGGRPARRILAAILGACLVILGGLAPIGSVATAAAATGAAPKVVIIVGPFGSVTDAYRSDADAAAAEALKYTPNVVKVYTPTATWAAAKAALQGASIVVYMGHGTGWPSPYAPFRATLMDGLGLNPTAGTDNTTTQYWGESYLASDVKLAPNAVVILAHLCYSAGNSEPGNPDPTFAVAQQRVDNMAAGWIGAGARAVIAEVYGEGLYGGAAWYMDQLFGPAQTIDQVWRSDPTSHGHVVSFPSVRSPGFTAEMDPDGVMAPPFHRSIVADLALRTTDVVAGATAPTSTTAIPAVATTPATAPPVTSPAGLTSATASPHYFFPQDGDRYAATTRFAFTLDGPSTVTATVVGPGGVIVPTPFTAAALAGGPYAWTWDGRLASGAWAPRGRYNLKVVATDGTVSTTRTTWVVADAFSVAISPRPPTRGQLVTITVTSSEPLRANARLRIVQPGVAARVVTMAHVSATVYRVVVRLSSGGTAGTLSLVVSGTDLGGLVNATTLRVPLH